MVLLDRISGNQAETEEKISVHQLQASLHLWQLGIIEPMAANDVIVAVTRATTS